MDRLKENKNVAMISVAFIAIIVILITVLVPIVQHHIKVSSLKKQIEKVQLQIELNQTEWQVCHDNMQLRHEENEANREILNNLMLQYNEMVGFTTAWH